MFTFPPPQARPLWRRTIPKLLRSPARPRFTAARSHESHEGTLNQQALQAELNQPHLYSSIDAPTPADLSSSRKFFTDKAQRLLFHCEYFREFPRHQVPEIAILGRSNSGKSSFINALTSTKDTKSGFAYVSKRAGCTRYMQCYAVGPRVSGGWGEEGGKKNGVASKKSRERWVGEAGRGAQIIIVDTPGFGFGSEAAQGVEMIKYLRMRKNLRMTYVLLQTEHGIKEHDWEVLDLLEQNGVPHAVILSKIDLTLIPGKAKQPLETLEAQVEELKKRSATLVEMFRKRAADKGRASVMTGDVFPCSSARSLGGKPKDDGPIGIAGIRWAMLQAAGWGEPVALEEPQQSMEPTHGI